MSQRHALALITMISISITIVPNVLGQDATIENLRKEIRLLKKEITEQNKRIERLEQELINLKNFLKLKAESKEIQSPVVYSTGSGWKEPSNWDRIRDGMSEKQVVSILGKPTSIEDSGVFRTLFYQGEVSGSGYISGNVKLTDDRVYFINKPVF